MLWKTEFFEKKGNLSSQKNYLTFFSLIIEYEKPQETNYESPQDIQTLTLEL